MFKTFNPLMGGWVGPGELGLHRCITESFQARSA
jgi:hypothetical protein